MNEETTQAAQTSEGAQLNEQTEKATQLSLSDVATAQATEARPQEVSDQKARPPASQHTTEDPTGPKQAEQLEQAVARMQELEAVIANLQQSIETNAAQIDVNKAAMRNQLLESLGVIEKYKSFAPDVDPFTDEGKAELETWAKENTELLAARKSQPVEVDTSKVKKNMRSPHLVDFAKFAQSMKG